MLEYPDFLPLKTLEKVHPAYKTVAPTLTRIADLAAGGWQLEAKKAQYLKSRPGEDPELYKIRLEKFTYTNVLGGAIAAQVTKLASGSVSVSGLDDAEFWQKFRENNNKKGRSEKDLLGEVFERLLKFKRVYAHVEKPFSEFQPKTRQQEEMLSLLPYVCLYSPLEVTNWSESGDRLEWIKVRQLEEVSQLFGEALTRATWTFIDDTFTAKYEAFVKLNARGAIAEIVNEKGETIDSGEEAKISLKRRVAHGVGQIPLVEFECPDTLWVTNQAYLLAIECLNLENSRYDTAMMSGYVQRTYKPHVTPDNDLDRTFVDSQEDLKTGNQYVIKGDFGFSEASGSSVNTVSGLLLERRNAIEDMIGKGQASATKGAVEQSGISKKMDFVVQEGVLRKFGQILCDRYQDVLQLVGRTRGLSDAELEAISVTGLNVFDLDSLEGLLAVAIEMLPVESRLSPTALMLFYQELQSQLVKNASAQQVAEMVEELERRWATGIPVPPLPLDASN